MTKTIMDYSYPLNLYRDLCKELGSEPLPEIITQDEEKGIHNIINSMDNEKYKDILLSRYRDGKLFSEIADEYGFTHQRANQLLKSIIKNLCKNNFINMIFGYESYIATTIIEDLDFSTRAERALLRNEINTLDDIKYYGKDGIKKLRNIGTDTYDEIISKTWFLWDDDNEDKLSDRHVQNITKILLVKGWKRSEISKFILEVETME